MGTGTDVSEKQRNYFVFVSRSITAMNTEVRYLFAKKSRINLGNKSIMKSWWFTESNEYREYLILAINEVYDPLLFCVVCMAYSAVKCLLCTRGLPIVSKGTTSQNISRHFKSAGHHKAIERYLREKEFATGEYNENKEKTIKKNRHILKKIVEVLINISTSGRLRIKYKFILKCLIIILLFVYLIGQPLRSSHIENIKNIKLDAGNLYVRRSGEGPVFSLLKYACINDEVLYDHMTNAQAIAIRNISTAGDTTFLSVYFWHKCLKIISNAIVKHIVDDIILNGNIFGLEIDTTSDISRKEEAAVALKYAKCSQENGFEVEERTAIFKHIPKLGGKNVFAFTSESLHKIGLDIKNSTGELNIIIYCTYLFNEYKFSEKLAKDLLLV